MNAELYRRGVPAFVRVLEVVRAPAMEGEPDWSFALERSPVPLHDDDTAARYAEALFSYEREVDEVAAWAADRFAVAWDEAPARVAVFIPSPVHAAYPQRAEAAVPAEKTAGGD
jgi:predicted 3-demethylubiquinone-9 3-methyltransferase (glyoxalase superfamily)